MRSSPHSTAPSRASGSSTDTAATRTPTFATSPSPSRAATVAAHVGWLYGHWPEIEAGPDAARAVQLLTGALAIARRIAPWTPQARRLDGVPCPRPECLCTALVIEAGEVDITCRECGFVIPEDRYPVWTKYAALTWGDLLQVSS